MKKLSILILVFGSCFAALSPIYAQGQPTQQPAQQPTAEELENAKAERKKNAYRLLDQVIDEAQSLRLTENRVRVQTTAADLLWDSNQGRARSLFAMAAEGVAELNRAQPATNNRRGPQQVERRSYQLRQELILAAARHDAQLAYQLLAVTKPPAQPVQPASDNRIAQLRPDSEENLEQMLLGRIAALDPKLAAQNAEQLMDKGQFPRALPEVVNQLNNQDRDASARLADKMVKKLQATNLLTNLEAANLAQTLLILGPRPPNVVVSQGRAPVLEQSAYTELLGSVVDLVLKAAVQTPNQRNQPQRVARPAIVAGGGGPAQINSQPQPSEAQERNTARRLLTALQAALPLIDQYLPAKSALVRQKLAEGGLGTTSPLNVGQTFSALQGNATADALVQAAAAAPPQMQSRLYQQAAFKALEEGDTNRARQIATDHLQANARETVMRRIDFREMSQKTEGARLEDIRLAVARLQSEGDKIGMLLQVARDAEKVNPKLASQVLDEARQMINRRATGYEHFEQQLRVAHAFLTVDPARSFEVLDPAISQLNELLAAAAVLNGFEVNMFRDGEMTLQGGGGLTSMVQRFGQELGQLADKDLERAETLAGRFQYAESRIVARLAIVQGLLGVNVNRPPLNLAGGPINVFRN